MLDDDTAPCTAGEAVSYDFRIVPKGSKWGEAAGECACGRKHGAVIYDLGNPTYNLGAIFREATGRRFKQGEPIPAAEALRMWRVAAEDMTAHPEKYRPLEHENKWGNLDEAIRVATKCADALAELEADGYIEGPMWEALAGDQCPTNDEIEARQNRRVTFHDLVFIA
jgi:hypothetical protein